jgi:SAM-dependent methyltransferase
MNSVTLRSSYYGRHYAEIAGAKIDDLGTILALIEELKPDTRVLDLMGGFGRVGLYLSQRGYETTVVDRSEELLKIGRTLADSASASGDLPISFVSGDVNAPLDQLPLSWWGALVCAHYAMNEITVTLDPLMSNVSMLLEENGLAIFNVLADRRYSPEKEWEDLALGPDASWSVQTLVSPLPHLGPKHHRLYFRYMPKADGAPFECFVDRRIWTAAEIDSAATKAGLLPVASKCSETTRLYQRLSHVTSTR